MLLGWIIVIYCIIMTIATFWFAWRYEKSIEVPTIPYTELEFKCSDMKRELDRIKYFSQNHECTALLKRNVVLS